MILRTIYIEQVVGFIDKPQIKILTGIRRSGKSTVLRFLEKELLQRGVSKQQIIHVNFESFVYADLLKARELDGYIKTLIKGSLKHYLLLDGIQEVARWEKVVNSFLVDFDVDLYLSGSNPHLLSSQLATYLPGR